jgi:hypothetical protein
MVLNHISVKIWAAGLNNKKVENLEFDILPDLKVRGFLELTI